MPRLSLWGGPKKQNDYKFVDRQISEFISASGTAAYVHLNIGTYPATPKTTITTPITSTTSTPPSNTITGGTDDQNPLSSTYLYDYNNLSDPAHAATISTEGYGYGNETIRKFEQNDPDWQFIVQGQNPGGTTFSSVNDPSIVLTGSGTGTTATPSGGTQDTANPTTSANAANNVSNIQDLLFLENRDRKYSPNVYELRITYNVADADFDLTQWGIQFTNDTLFAECHFNDMVAICGRRLLAGDVVELPHLRDDSNGYDPNSPSINKFYVVNDAYRAASGYSSTWLPHIWRMKLSPITDSQEYADILAKNSTDPYGLTTGNTLKDILSTMNTAVLVNDGIVEAAAENVKKRYFGTQQFYFVPGSETGTGYAWLYAGDGIPNEEHARPVESGHMFPTNPQDGDYFVRIDYQPNTLFKWDGGNWGIIECDYRGSQWKAVGKILDSFINNDATTTMKDGETFAEKQPLHNAVKPRADF